VCVNDVDRQTDVTQRQKGSESWSSVAEQTASGGKDLRPLFTQHPASSLYPLLFSCLHLTLAPLCFTFLCSCLYTSLCLSLRPRQETLNKPSLSSSQPYLTPSLSLSYAHTNYFQTEGHRLCVLKDARHCVFVCVHAVCMLMCVLWRT